MRRNSVLILFLVLIKSSFTQELFISLPGKSITPQNVVHLNDKSLFFCSNNEWEQTIIAFFENSTDSKLNYSVNSLALNYGIQFRALQAVDPETIIGIGASSDSSRGSAASIFKISATSFNVERMFTDTAHNKFYSGTVIGDTIYTLVKEGNTSFVHLYSIAQNKMVYKQKINHFSTYSYLISVNKEQLVVGALNGFTLMPLKDLSGQQKWINNLGLNASIWPVSDSTFAIISYHAANRYPTLAQQFNDTSDFISATLFDGNGYGFACGDIAQEPFEPCEITGNSKEIEQISGKYFPYRPNRRNKLFFSGYNGKFLNHNSEESVLPIMYVWNIENQQYLYTYTLKPTKLGGYYPVATSGFKDYLFTASLFTDSFNQNDQLQTHFYITDLDGNPIEAVPVSVQEKEVNSVSHYSLYPNPTSTTFSLRGDKTQIKEAFLLNSVGQVITDLSSKQLEESIEVSGLSKGIYFLRIMQNNGASQVQKLIVN